MTITRYAIRRVSADGTSTTHELVDCGEEFELYVYDGDEGPVVTKLGELPGGFTELLLTSPELVTVGTGFTDISTDGSIDIHTLLGLLVVEDPSAEEPDVDDWLDENGEVRAKLGFDLEDWAFASEQIHHIRGRGKSARQVRRARQDTRWPRRRRRGSRPFGESEPRRAVDHLPVRRSACSALCD